MPRKTLPLRGLSGGAAGGFNEAAARCRGKPAGGGGQPAQGHAASMRPRPDAAENRATLNPETPGHWLLQ